MRIWHKELIPKLCRQHLLAVWREGLGAYSIITQNKKGYRNHPAVKEWKHNPYALWTRLDMIRSEMIKRNYNPKPLPMYMGSDAIAFTNQYDGTTIIGQLEPDMTTTPWQTLKEQIEILRQKGCECKVN